MQNGKLFRILFFMLIFLIIVQLFNRNQNNGADQDDIAITAKSKFTTGQIVTVKIHNNTEGVINLPNPCPQNPLIVEKYQNGEWILKEATIEAKKCENQKSIVINSHKSYELQYSPWNHKLFGEIGHYRIGLKATLENKEKHFYHEFDVVQPSFLRRFWNGVFYKPIFNTLIFLISVVPGHSLGLAIIILTLIIKIILLAPNQKALKSQKKMQLVQPQLEALKRKYKNDQQRLAQETMALWKKHKVSPMGSCLPMLIQFPILIALFYVVKDGLEISNPDLLYEGLRNFDLQSINPIFLGIIDLTKINIIALPIIVGGLQFIQMRLSLGSTKKTKSKKDGPDPLPMMNQMMQYMMPAMIAIFTASLPAAVGFYWGTSTLFGIGQQIVVNRSKN